MQPLFLRQGRVASPGQWSRVFLLRFIPLSGHQRFSSRLTKTIQRQKQIPRYARDDRSLFFAYEVFRAVGCDLFWWAGEDGALVALERGGGVVVGAFGVGAGLVGEAWIVAAGFNFGD